MQLAATSPFRVALQHPGAAVLLALWVALAAGFILATGHAPPSTIVDAIVRQ